MTIDHLKFDIEGSERGALKTILKDGVLHHVRLIAFEIHSNKEKTKGTLEDSHGP